MKRAACQSGTPHPLYRAFPDSPRVIRSERRNLCNSRFIGSSAGPLRMAYFYS